MTATEEFDRACNHYRNERIPKDALAVMDGETERLRAECDGARSLKPGETAPDFTLPGAQGEPVRLYGLLREGPAVVVFYRGGWCPYCNIHLRSFQRSLPELRELGAQIVAVSPQLPDQSLSTRERNALEFPVLSDVGNKVAHQYGVAFRLSDRLLKLYVDFGHPLEASNGPDGAFELPVPATFVLDTEGIVLLSHVEVDYTRRLDPDDVVARLRQLNK